CLEGEHAAQADMQAQREVSLGFGPIAGEAVDDASLRAQLASEDGGGVPAGLARVHDDGLAQLTGEADLGCEQVALYLARRTIVVVVESTFPYGHAVRLAADRFQLAQVFGGGAGRVVGVDTGGGTEEGAVGACQLERLPRSRHPPSRAGRQL